MTDGTGLIYGMGHAGIHHLRSPRRDLQGLCRTSLAAEKDMEAEYQLYASVERAGSPDHQQDERRMYKGVSVNVDFYSGFVYQMLGIPEELFTPMFAIARISGWSAHRLEELVNRTTASSAPPTRPFCLGGSTRKLRRDKMQQTLHGLRANQKERVEFLDTLRRVFRSENASFFTT